MLFFLAKYGLQSGLQNFALLSDYHCTTDESLSVCLKINGVATANVSASSAAACSFNLRPRAKNEMRLETSEGTAWDGEVTLKVGPKCKSYWNLQTSQAYERWVDSFVAHFEFEIT